jgi:hypothetical protein
VKSEIAKVVEGRGRGPVSGHLPPPREVAVMVSHHRYLICRAKFSSRRLADPCPDQIRLHRNRPDPISLLCRQGLFAKVGNWPLLDGKPPLTSHNSLRHCGNYMHRQF